MFISLFFKHWRNLLDALILIGVIVFIFLWNPFNIFGSGLNLQNTANLVSNVRSIGQLVTAEYYGEVIASLNEAELNLIEENYLFERAEEIYVGLKKEAFNQFELEVLPHIDENKPDKKNKKVRDGLKKAIKTTIIKYNAAPEKFRRDSADVVLFFLTRHVFNKEIKLKDYKSGRKKRKHFKEKQLETLFYYVKAKYDSLTLEQFDNFLNQGFESSESFTDFYYDFFEAGKKKLAMIGRGWVKAGFDFGKLDARRFNYDKETGIVHLFGIVPQILDTDINPWFIPERGVPGFDIVTSRKVNFEDARLVKTYCKRKLQTYALEANILGQAKEYGEAAIKEFFSLITGEEIKSVLFHTDELLTVLEQIGRDSLITVNELPLIDSTATKYMRSVESLQDASVKARKNELLANFWRGLRDLEFEYRNTKMPFNYFTKQLPKILSDTIIDDKEYSAISNSLRWKIIEDSTFIIPAEYQKNKFWFDDSLRFVADYDNFVSNLIALNNQENIYTLKQSRFILKSGTNAFADSITKFNSILGTENGKGFQYSVIADTFEVRRVVSVLGKGATADSLLSLYYNLSTDPQLLLEIIKSDSFAFKPIDLRVDNHLTTTSQQETELNAYHKFIFNEHTNYKDRPWVLRASEKFRGRFFNRKKIGNVGATIKNKMKSLTL